MTGFGGSLLVKAQRTTAQTPTPLPHENKVLSAGQTVAVSRPYAALAGWVTALALHGGGVPIMTEMRESANRV